MKPDLRDGGILAQVGADEETTPLGQQSGERKFSVRFGRQGGDASAVAGKVQDRQAERQHGREVALR